MTHSRRKFVKRCVTLGGGAFCLPLLPGVLHASPDSPDTVQSQEAVCPKSAPPAKTLWAVRIEDSKKGSEERLPLSCLQGLVNRRQPQIFLAYDRFDEQWLDWLRERGDVKEVRWVGPKQLYEKFLPVVKELVVTDPDLPASVNVATMLAAVEGWLPVTPRLRTEFPRVNVALDLRGKWKKNIEAYRWFYAAYGERMSRRACAHYDPGQFELRDYFVQFKIPMVWVAHPNDAQHSPAASPAEETQFARDLFQKLPANIPCLGWWDHGLGGEDGCGENGPYSGLDLASQHGKFQLCTAFDGYGRGVGNLSVHSGTSATFHQKAAAPPPPLADKVYYTYTRTDGDGMNFWRQVYRDLWDQPAHGRVPVGWQTGPAASDLIPDILDYFYRHATPNDVFVNALTGVGYIREAVYLERLPQSEQEAAWKQYIELSRRYFKRLDLSLLTTFEAFQLMPPKTLARFTELPGIKAIYRNYARFGDTTVENAATELNGVPIFRAILEGNFELATPEDIRRSAAAIARQIRQFTPARRPAFLHLSLTNWFVDMRVLVEVEKALGPDYVAVRADHLPALYLEAKKGR
jgi:hypothetical protein